MTLNAKIAPQNSLLLIMDKDSNEIPESMNGQLVSATPSCIAVKTLCGADGETSVTLSDDRLAVREVENLKKVFSGNLETPRNIVEVCTILNEPVLSLRVPTRLSNVEVWANSESEPDMLSILILPGSESFQQSAAE